jgi:arabinan endo-1,5-alpha-L-arabinosidase
VTKFGNTYYCYYSVSTIGSQESDIGVATSNSLQPGTWQDRGSIGIPRSDRYNKIDPYVYQEDESNPTYFMFGSYWTGIQQIEMSSRRSLLNWTRPDEDIKNVIRNQTTDAAVVEGAAQWKQDDWYYIFYSVGACCNIPPNLVSPGNEYHIAVCRADSITGPYYDKDGKNCLTENGGTTILASHGDIYAPGGQEVMAHPDNDKTVLYYHYGKSTRVASGELKVDKPQCDRALDMQQSSSFLGSTISILLTGGPWWCRAERLCWKTSGRADERTSETMGVGHMIICHARGFRSCNRR